MTAIAVEQVGSRWIAKTSYQQREIPKAAGFRWDRDNKCWYTTDAKIASLLSDPTAAAQAADDKRAMKEQAIEASRASDADVDLPVPDGLSYLPYQRAGIAYGLNHPNVLFGDEMGLGKTIQAIGIINADPTLQKILVICPASLRLNWQREMRKWLVREMRSVIATGTSWPTGFEINVISYDILIKHTARLLGEDWDLVVIDEAHYCKNPDAKRTQAVVGKDAKKGEEAVPGIKARRRLMLTGTPIPNRPIEGWPLFHWLAPDEFRSFFGYAKQFCGAHHSGYGWDFSGSSNLGALQDKLRSTIMIRRLKADVLKELPAKRRQLVEIPANGSSGAVKAETDAWVQSEARIERLRIQVELAKALEPGDYTDAVSVLRDAVKAAFDEISSLRHHTALAKVPHVIEHVNDALAEDGHKIVLFAHHSDVVAKLMEALREAKIDAVSITGDTAMTARQDAVDRFQTQATCRVFVGNIQAAGVGLTLTAAAHVIFAELDWVPGNITQAEDRCHRIGQHDSVLVQHLVLDGSIDARMAKTLIEKQDIIDRALDREHVEIATATPSRERASTEVLTRDKLSEIAETLTLEQITAIHTALQMLAGMDMDHARELNGIGYSKMDAAIGHSLAERSFLSPRQAALGQKLITRYRRQLPADIVALSTQKLS